MTTPVETHQALAAAIERVAEVARAATPWPNRVGNVLLKDRANAVHIALHNPKAVLDRCTRDRERAEQHVWVLYVYASETDPLVRCCTCLVPDDEGYAENPLWPCPGYRDLLADYGIEVP